MWKHANMEAHVKKDTNIKIEKLADKFGFPEITSPAGSILHMGEIGQNNIEFVNRVLKHEEGYNPLDIKLNNTGAYLIMLKNEDKDKDIIGHILSIPNRIYLAGFGLQNSILTTHLLIDPEYRKKRYAEVLILTTIKEAFEKNIKIGYHWIRENKTDFAILSYSWYRPISLSKILGKGYDLEKNNSYSIPLPDFSITHRQTVSKDFMILKSDSKIRLCIDDDQLKYLSNVITFYTFIQNENSSAKNENDTAKNENEKIIGIVGIRKFDIVKPKFTIDAVQLCYFDCFSGYEEKILTATLRICKELNYAIMHGVIMSKLGNVIDSMKLTISDEIWLDFVNMSHPNLKIMDLALLYV